MTVRAIVVLMTLLLVTDVLGQTRTLTGKIIDEEFTPLSQVSIMSADTILLAKSGMTGDFSIAVPKGVNRLIVADVGMEWKILELSSDCNSLEIILQFASTYDFMSPAKVDRRRKKEFDELPRLYQSAFEKGIFKADKPCYIDRFISYKKEKIERHKSSKPMPGT